MRIFLIFFTLLVAVSGAASHKIVGGHDVSISQRPFQAALFLYGQIHCGGVIISSEWILTAAHCLPWLAWGVSFRVGSSHYNRGGQKSRADWFQKHPSYDDESLDYDIAVVHLSAPLKLSRDVQPVILPRAGQVWAAGTIATTSGWGERAPNEPDSSNLRAVSVPLIGHRHCSAMYKGWVFTKRMLCAGLLKGGKDACGGDSGGPLTVYDPPVLAGVVSWGDRCALANKPGVYADVGYLRSFIKKYTNI